MQNYRLMFYCMYPIISANMGWSFQYQRTKLEVPLDMCQIPMQIVVINNVDPDSLPPVAAAPTVTTAAGEKKQRQNISQKPKDPPADSPKPKPKATLEADGPDFIADNKEVQPPVVDTIKLASGISLRAGAAVQSGPKRVVDIDHMTKRDHAKYLIKAAAENVVTLTGTKGTKGSKLPTQSSLGGKLQAQGSTAAKQAGIAAQIGSSATQPLKQRLQQQQQQQAAGSGSLALLTQVSDNEQLKWARDGVPRKVAAKVVERPPSPVDPTLALLSSADWGLSSAVKGRSPAQLPSKEALDAGQACAYVSALDCASSELMLYCLEQLLSQALQLSQCLYCRQLMLNANLPAKSLCEWHFAW